MSRTEPKKTNETLCERILNVSIHVDRHMNGVWCIVRSSTFCKPVRPHIFDMDVDRNTGLPQINSSHLWLQKIGSAHRWPHHREGVSNNE